MAIEILLLGRLCIAKDGQPCELPARKTEALLCLLALRPGVPLEREQLAALLWPEVPEQQGRTSLRQALGHLRSRISDALVVSSADQVHLAPAAATVDTAEVERLLRRPPSERERAAAYLRGPLLAAFPAVTDAFAEWLAAERRRFSERALARLEECLGALSAAGQIERAVELGDRLVDLDPTREPVHRALMRLELARGERASALRRYEHCRSLLTRELGVEPSPETEQVRGQALGAGTASAGPSRVPKAASDGRLILAVLPFEAPDEQANGKLLAAGLSEDVTTELSRFRQLAVIARSAIQAGGSRSPDALVSELGATLRLSGSVRSLGELSRVTAALVDTTTGLQLWAEHWDVEHTNLFGALDGLTRSVVAALCLKIDEAQLRGSRRRAREDLRAYECWLRGMECVRRGSAGSDTEARAFFEQALLLDPDFARAHAGISLSHFNDWSCLDWPNWDERERLAFESAQRSVELDAEDHVSRYILGRIHVYRREFATGERHLETALSLNPNDVEALMHTAVGFTLLGHAERARALVETALQLYPSCPPWYFAIAAVPQFFSRRPEAALAFGLKAPDSFVDTRALLAAASAHAGDLATAREHFAAFIQTHRQRVALERETSVEAAISWLFKVNPLRRQADAEYWLDGLRRAAGPAAGLPLTLHERDA